MKILKHCFSLLIIAVLFCYTTGTETEVTIKQGKLKGVPLKSRNGTDYIAFYGIPFAKPPIGELRFEPPEEPDSWIGVRNATTQPPSCLQRNVYAINKKYIFTFGQEDCLYLNVFTPAVSSSKLLPTIVHIHGGAFVVGSGTHVNPMYFMDHPVVNVVIQYRLNIIGFLSAGDEVLPGNYGLKDQVAALKWVQQNIRAFGGDPNSVTIIGGSAGGASTSLHIYSPLSKGLFHRAISGSGTALAPWAQISGKVARERALAVGILTGCPTKSTSALVKCLKELSAEELIDVHDKLFIWNVQPSILFNPVVEPKTVKDAFLVDNPWTVNAVSEVPWVTGITAAEGAVVGSRYLDDDASLGVFSKNYRRFFPLIFGYGYWMENKNITQVSDAIKKYYFAGEDISTKNARKFIDMLSDGDFSVSSLEAAARYKGKSYFYYYDHRNAITFNTFYGTSKMELGACHGDESISLYFIPGAVANGSDLAVSERLVNYVVNFAYNGNPNGNGNAWQPVESKAVEYLHITTEKDFMEKNLLQERRDFWVDLLSDYPEKSNN